MTETKQKIVNEILKNFNYNTYLDNELFTYWIDESYVYSGEEFNREEFKAIQKYVVTHGTVPATRTVIEEGGKTIWLKNDSDSTYGYHHQRVLRYSKTYDTLEMYDFDTSLKSPHKSSSNRIMVLSKRRKILSVNSKNYVLFNGNRWLSLKNWLGFYHKGRFKVDTVKLLMSTMLGGKDWVLNLELEEGHLITNKNARKANSFEEAMELECGAKPAKSLLNFFDKNDVICLYNLIDPNKIHDITNFIKRNKNHLDVLMKDNYSNKYSKLLFLYFLGKDNRCEEHTISDYIRMLQEEGGKINLNISSYKTLKRNHDALSAKILAKKRKKTKKKRLKVAKHYPDIKSLPDMKVEQIRSVKRLDHESAILHHCVHGYDAQINRGECCIYSVVHNNQRYTLQINASKVHEEHEVTGASIPKKTEDGEFIYEFKIAQLKGKYNCNAPESIRKSLELMCKNHDIIPFEKSRVNLRPNVYEPKEHKAEPEQRAQNVGRVTRVAEPKIEVVQIGEKILEQMASRKASRMVVADENLPF